MRSLDNLREYVTKQAHINEVVKSCVVAYVDKIEREVADMVPLPVDADGEPINVGDVMEGWGSFEYHDLMEQPVESMVLHDRGRWEVCCDYVSTWEPSRLRHHHAPTVEDVLREFAEKIIDSQIPNVHPTYDEAIAEYAAKLRLAGDE